MPAAVPHQEASPRRLMKQRRFLAAFAALWNVQAACVRTGLPRRTVYNWIACDDAFARDFADAKDTATDRLEAECRRRAVDGVEEPVYYRGQVVGSVRRYSDACLLALLKAYRPDRFTGRGGHARTADRAAASPIVRVSYDYHMKPDDLE